MKALKAALLALVFGMAGTIGLVVPAEAGKVKESILFGLIEYEVEVCVTVGDTMVCDEFAMTLAVLP